MFELVCIDLVRQVEKVVMAFERLSDALAAEQEYQRLADIADKPLQYEIKRAA